MNVFGLMSDKKTDSSPEDIPRQDLLNLCMKLNKRMKSLEGKYQEMSSKHNVVVEERNKLMDLIAVTTDIPIAENESVDIDHIKDVLLHHLNSHKIKNKELNDRILLLEENIELQESNQHFKDKNSESRITCSSAVDSKRQDERIEKLKDKLYSLELLIEEKNTRIAYLERKIDIGASAPSSVQENEKNTQKGNDKFQTSENIIKEQKLQLVEYASEVDNLRKTLLETERKSSANSLLKAEQEALLTSLRKDLTTALNSKEAGDRKIKDLEEYRIRTEGKLGNFAENKDKLFQRESELDEAHAMIKRLQGSLQTAELTLAVRTADLASSAQELLSAKSSFNDIQFELKELSRMNQSLQEQLQYGKEELKKMDAKHCEVLKTKEAELAKMVEKNREELHTRQIAFDSSVNELKQDQARKSQNARLLLDEKVNIIEDLTSRNKLLREEIESGQPADRKIFELASRQATREANLQSSRDARELAFQQLQSSLAVKDLELAKLQDSYQRLMSEVSELRCVKNRETVNMDYLKNIILQYMSFPSSSPERAGLVPVISLLLQFNEEEKFQASSGAAKESLLWNTRSVKELKIHPSRNARKSYMIANDGH